MQYTVQKKCSVPGCTSTNKLFCLPRTDSLRRKWLEQLQRYDLIDIPYNTVKHYMVCSNHFAPWQFQTPEQKKLNRSVTPVNNLPGNIGEGKQTEILLTDIPIKAASVSVEILISKSCVKENAVHPGVSVLTKIPNLCAELFKAAPQIPFKKIDTDTDFKHLHRSEIIIADFDLLIPHLDSLTETKWIQGTWAGVDKLLPHFNNENFRSTIISRFSGQHFGRLMSEYVVANIVNYERNMFSMYENKKHKIWSQDGRTSQYRSLADLTVGILGVGNIGNYVAKTVFSFGSKVWGFGRRDKLPNTDEYKHYERYCTFALLPALLNKCDYIVNVLPSTNETKGLLNNGMLKNCSGKRTVFINIGRGNIINENDLIEALNDKWLSAAILDVFENEPLPENSELWAMDQVFVTPHVAGVSRAKDIAEQFLENYNLYKSGKEIPTQLSPGKEY